MGFNPLSLLFHAPDTMELSYGIVVYLSGLIATTLMFKIASSMALLRGLKGGELPRWLENILRSFFLLSLVWPVIWFFTISTPFIIVYWVTYLDGTENNGHGRPSKYLKTWWFYHWFLKKVMDVRLVKTVDLNPDRQYIFGLHPHAILPLGGGFNVASDINGFDKLFPGIELRGLGASFCFYVPIYRDLILGGGIVDASRSSARKVLKNKYSVWVVPGGATEALYCTPDVDKLQLKNRAGFIKLALEHNCELVPVFSFGESDTYSQLSTTGGFEWVGKVQRAWQHTFGFSLPLITNIIPKRVPVTTVVGGPVSLGRPLKTPGQPSSEEIQELMDLYIKALLELYDKFSEKYNSNPKKKLVIV